MIYVGIDDTDIVGSPGTNQLARKIVRRLGHVARRAIVCRHQLFFDPRVPFTSGNGSASIQLPHGDDISSGELIACVLDEMRDFFVEGSDPGLAVARTASADMIAFAARATTEVVDQSDARTVAARSECYLEGLGGTNQGIIGALAAVALAASGDHGRVVHVNRWPWRDRIHKSPVRRRYPGAGSGKAESGEAFTGDAVDITAPELARRTDGTVCRAIWRRDALAAACKLK